MWSNIALNCFFTIEIFTMKWKRSVVLLTVNLTPFLARFISQLGSGAVYYEHQLPEEPFWVTRDSIELILSSQPAPDVLHVLPITVSYYAAHSNISSQLWRNKGELRLHVYKLKWLIILNNFKTNCPLVRSGLRKPYHSRLNTVNF